MTTLELIFTIVLGCIALFLIIFYGIKLFKNKLIKKIYEDVVEAMKEAETKQLSGEDKKKYVLSKVEETCKDNGIPYGFIATLISKVIENIIKGYNSMVK